MSTISKNKFCIVICFVIACLKLEAQFLDKSYYLVDSLQSSAMSENDRTLLNEQIRKYHATSVDTTKIQVLSELIENLQDEKIWIKYNHLLNETAKRKLKTITNTNDRTYFVYKTLEGLALNNFGYYYFNYTTKLDIALAYYNEGMVINEKLKYYDALISSYSNVGNTYQNQGDLNTALIYFQKALALENQTSNKSLLLSPLNNIAQVYFHINDTAKALETLKNAYRISLSSGNDYVRGSLMHNIGSLMVLKGDAKGVQMLRNALAFRKKIGDKKGTLHTTLSLVGIANDQGNYLLSEQYLQDASRLIEDFRNSAVEAFYYTQLGDYHAGIGKTELAIADQEKAISMYKQKLENPDMLKALDKLLKLYSLDNKKYAFKKLEVYELQQKVVKNIDKSKTQQLLLKQKYEEDLKINEAKFKLEQQLKDEKNKSEKFKQQLVLIIVCLVLLVVIVFAFFIFRALKVNKQKNKIISDQKAEVEHQKQLIEEKHKDITDSITYAHRIQSALIPTQEQLHAAYPQLKVLFKPKDIVSGDFYWHSHINDLQLFAMADCTGHGVPGAFMSIIGINCLNTLITEKGIYEPDRILNELKKGVVKSLNSDQRHSDKKDGMDIALIAFTKQKMIFSGANQSLLLLRNHELIQLKGNKQPVGLSDTEENFTSQEVELMAGDRIILFSDGMVDQFGGAYGKKLKAKEFRNWLLETASMDLGKQLETIEQKLALFMKGYEQTDDITLALIEI